MLLKVAHVDHGVALPAIGLDAVRIVFSKFVMPLNWRVGVDEVPTVAFGCVI